MRKVVYIIFILTLAVVFSIANSKSIFDTIKRYTMQVTHLMSANQAPKVIKMDPEDFISIRENPIQRDTEPRAIRANKKNGHLRHAHPTHSVVSVALLVEEETDTRALTEQEITQMILSYDAEAYKLDGHTRSYLWEGDKLEMPESLVCAVYFVSDIEQVKDFYRAYDSNKAVETSKDKLWSALRDALGATPRNPIWKKTGVKGAMEAIFNKNQTFKDERLFHFHETDKLACEVLKVVDQSTRLHLPALSGSVMAAMLASILRDGPKALEFWEQYSNSEGYLIHGEADAVYLAITYSNEISVMGSIKYGDTRPNYIITGSGREVHEIHTPMFLDYYTKWKKNKNRRYKIKPKNKYGIVRKKTHITIESFLGNQSYRQFCATYNGSLLPRTPTALRTLY